MKVFNRLKITSGKFDFLDAWNNDTRGGFLTMDIQELADKLLKKITDTKIRKEIESIKKKAFPGNKINPDKLVEMKRSLQEFEKLLKQRKIK